MQSLAERLDFLKDRQKGIGASDIPAILGLNPYRDALDVYHEKTRPIDEEEVAAEVENPSSVGILRGNVLEPLAVRHFFARTGRDGRHEKDRAYEHPAYPGVRVHVDGTQFEDFAPEGHEGSGTLEAKAPSSTVFSRLVEGGLDDRHVVQIQAELATRRHTWGSFAFYNLESSQGPLHAVDVEANESLGSFLLETATQFWERHVQERRPPEVEDWAEKMETAPPLNLPTGDVIDLDSPKARRLAEEVNEARELKSRGEELYEERREKMGEFLREIGKVGIRVPELGTYRWIERSGRSYLGKKRVIAAAPLDRDAFVRWYVQEVDTGPNAEEAAEEVADALALDVEGLCSQSDPSAYVGVYPKS